MSALYSPQGLIGWLRLVAIAEGISYLSFAITMPLKYGLDIHGPNWVVGAAHGALFISYGLLALVSIFRFRWPFWTAIGVLAASLIPFGTFVADRKVFLPQQKETPAAERA